LRDLFERLLDSIAIVVGICLVPTTQGFGPWKYIFLVLAIFSHFLSALNAQKKLQEARRDAVLLANMGLELTAPNSAENLSLLALRDHYQKFIS
jgi:hypothetical protein